ncbi:candidapepsin-9 [[Candida] anglica]
MKLEVLSIVASLIAVTTAKNVATPLKLDFSVQRGTRNDHSSDYQPHLVKRQTSNDSFTMELINESTFYVAALEFGTKGDKVSVLVDTGSSDLWIPSHDVICYETPYMKKRSEAFTRDVKEGGNDIDDIFGKHGIDPTKASLSSPIEGGNVQKAVEAMTNTCTTYGSFATGNSGTFKTNTTNQEFYIAYADNTEAIGVWGYDDVKIGDTIVKDLSFAVVNQSSSNVGVLGIGYASLETTFSAFDEMYDNLPLKLKGDGLIKKNAYSLYLNSNDTKSGSILFGAVDHAKYEGQLQTVQIVGAVTGSYPDPNRIIVVLSGISVDDNGNDIGVSGDSYPALLDTGSTATFMPSALAAQISKALGGYYSTSVGAYQVPCSSDSNVNIKFNFSGVTISVPYEELILHYSSSCYLSIFPSASTSKYIIFGDNFLRRAYVVYDLEDHVVALAQVKYTDKEDIEVISDGIPSAVKAEGYSSTAYSTVFRTSQQTATAGISGSARSSSRSTSTSSSTSSSSRSSANSSKLLPVTFLMLALVGTISIFTVL